MSRSACSSPHSSRNSAPGATSPPPTGSSRWPLRSPGRDLGHHASHLRHPLRRDVAHLGRRVGGRLLPLGPQRAHTVDHSITTSAGRSSTGPRSSPRSRWALRSGTSPRRRSGWATWRRPSSSASSSSSRGSGGPLPHERDLRFWFAYVVTRPIGASFADYFSKPKTSAASVSMISRPPESSHCWSSSSSCTPLSPASTYNRPIPLRTPTPSPEVAGGT